MYHPNYKNGKILEMIILNPIKKYLKILYIWSQHDNFKEHKNKLDSISDEMSAC